MITNFIRMKYVAELLRVVWKHGLLFPCRTLEYHFVPISGTGAFVCPACREAKVPVIIHSFQHALCSTGRYLTQ